MIERPDDDALRWEGDDEPLVKRVVLPEGFTAVGKGSDEVGRRDAEVEGPDASGIASAPAAMGNASLIVLGVLGGVYALFAIGWAIGGLRLQGTAEYLVTPAVYRVALWLAVAAVPLWFAVTYLLTRTSKIWVRVVWLVAGAVLLVPWPFIMVGMIGVVGR